jgi:hypothetical protein
MLVRLESVGLEQGLLYENPLPSLKSGSISIKECVVSLLPDKPCPKHEDLHEELWVKLMFGFYQHHMKGEIKVPMNSTVVPTLGTERAYKEQMKSGFLHTGWANRVVVVVVL